ncbi:GNAT family N-acetyltransferase [Myxococcota bacterium]
MPAISIRRARPEDAEVIAANNRAMAKETEDKHLDEKTLQTGVNEALSNPQRGFYLLAEKDGRVVGQTLITSEWSDWRNADFWWIQSVYVDPKERKSGVFRTLVCFDGQPQGNIFCEMADASTILCSPES